MMVETRPVGLFDVLLAFCFVVLVIFSTIRLTFPPFNDDLGTMPTRRPYSWKKTLFLFAASAASWILVKSLGTRLSVGPR